ncbi:hypothetical protein AZI85_17430 [Bdellovibrio bacteriovorus]|uniref:Nucleotidyltransferase n=1 Tax=Bdellovibrio bacteriovorus TaxID=959 RepID=A0A150WM49_BDEBC|nr:nucleotidyl transferase AbiEii/AbiGii toxin family protein [Bdellovibrio bacteriovorus]KYG65496.1 hypothetical protein AZI85_17430 [Bdellovibrio bacteriovorus]
MTPRQVMAVVTRELDAQKISSFIIGAAARDLLAERFGLTPSERKTSDIDFAILVPDWKAVDGLRKKLLGHPDIKVPSEGSIRFFLAGVPFDIVPFGGIEDQNHVVSWPPHHDTAMSVLGYSEAMKNVVDFEIEKQTVRVLSIEFFVALKLIAWGMNGARQRDIVDVGYLISNYSKINPDAYEYVLENNLDLLELLDHDYACAEIGCLGMQIASKLSGQPKEVIVEILRSEENIQQMIRDLLSIESLPDSESRDKSERKWKSFLRALLLGLNGNKE